MKHLTSKLITLICGIMLCFISFALAVFITLKASFLYPILAKDMDNALNLDQEIIGANYEALIDYNSNPLTAKLELEQLTMSDSGRLHFEEVRNIFMGIFLIGIIFAILILISKRWSYKKSWLPISKVALIISALFPIILIPSFIFAFDKLFVLFHKLLFNNDYWLFSSQENPIIYYLPQSFFEGMAIVIITIWFLILLVFRFVAGLNKKKL